MSKKAPSAINQSFRLAKIHIRLKRLTVEAAGKPLKESASRCYGLESQPVLYNKQM